MNRALGLVALTGFLLSLFVHVAAVAGVDVSARVPAVWLLHPGIFVVFVPFVFSRRRQAGATPRNVLAGLPLWAACAVLVLFGYAFVNFGVFMSRTRGGNPTVERGKYLLKSHGRLIREITLEE